MILSPRIRVYRYQDMFEFFVNKIAIFPLDVFVQHWQVNIFHGGNIIGYRASGSAKYTSKISLTEEAWGSSLVDKDNRFHRLHRLRFHRLLCRSSYMNMCCFSMKDGLNILLVKQPGTWHGVSRNMSYSICCI